MKNALNPFLNKQIGRRTGKDIKAGKKIRMLEGGFENFDDYWSESGQLHCGIVFFLTTANTQTHVYVWVSTYWHADFARTHKFQPSASALTRVHMYACMHAVCACTHTRMHAHNTPHIHTQTHTTVCTCVLISIHTNMPVHAQTRGVVFKSHQYTLIIPRRPVHLLRLIHLKTKNKNRFESNFLAF